MTISRMWKLGVLLVGASIAHATFADSWLPAATKQYVSADGAWRLTVEPRRITSPLNYFKDEVDGKERPGGVPGSSQASATGTMERRVDGAWERVWQRPLRNEVTPVDAMVLPGGSAMTLDNWHRMGIGKDAVVLYDAQGTVLAAYALTDFLPTDYVRALPHSVSSLHWRGEAKALPDGRRISVPVVVPSQDDADLLHDERAEFVPVIFDLLAGKVERPSGPAWEQAEQTARQVRAKQLVVEAEEHRFFTEPLDVPASVDERDWHRYMVEAFFRVDPDWQDGYPETTVLRSPDASDYRASIASLHDALRSYDREGAIMLASPSQDALVARIEAETKNIRADSLALARVYLVLDNTRFARAMAALSRSGARLIQIDPSSAIPQRSERLEKFMQGQKMQGE